MYKGIVAQIERVIEIPGADRIHLAVVLGNHVVVSKDWNEGFQGLFFPDGTQLSEKFCHDNNLFRDGALNADILKKGFFETNRRVRSQPFLKVKSEAFFCDLSALDTFHDGNFKPKLGESFDVIGEHKLCEKYISPQTRKAMANGSVKIAKQDMTPEFNKHVDTEQLLFNLGKIPEGALISIHHKVHGTSARYSKSLINLELNGFQKFVNEWIYPIFPTQKIEYLCGTRNVVLDDPDKQGFHGSEGYRFEVLELLKPHMTEGMTIYGEIAGYANGKPIMGKHSTEVLKDKKFTKTYGKEITYSYGCKEGEYRFHIYRITINRDGLEVDLTAPQVEAWCKARGFNYPLNMCNPFIYDEFVKNGLADFVVGLAERPESFLTADPIDSSHINEGVIVRVDHESIVPKFYKYKTYAFRVMEGIFKEKNVDVEDAS